jgi:molybdate transport system permease protein
MSPSDALGMALLSLRVALVAVLAAVVPAVALGWALARGRFRGKALLQTVVSLPMVLPPVAIGLLLLLVFSRHAPVGRLVERAFGAPLLLTWWAAALASSVMAFPFLVLGAKQAFEAVPVRLEQVAKSLGAAPWQVFRGVTLPLAARGIFHGATFGFARALGEFGATVIVAGNIPGSTETLALGIYARIESFQERDAVLLSLLALALALAFTGAAHVFFGPRAAGRARTP